MKTTKITFCQEECNFGQPALFVHTSTYGRTWNLDKRNNYHVLDFTGLDLEFDLRSRCNPDDDTTEVDSAFINAADINRSAIDFSTLFALTLPLF
jgi:hypothetical protein